MKTTRGRWLTNHDLIKSGNYCCAKETTLMPNNTDKSTDPDNETPEQYEERIESIPAGHNTEPDREEPIFTWTGGNPRPDSNL